MAWRNLVVLLIACGGSSGREAGDVTPFIGVYATTSQTRTEVFGTTIKCTDRGEPVADATPYFRLDVDSFFMDPDILTVSNCTDAAGTACAESGISLRAGGPGLQQDDGNSQTGDGSLCLLRFTHNQAVLTGSSVEIESLEKFDAPNLSSNDCTLQRAEALASSPDCITVQRWVGTRP